MIGLFIYELPTIARHMRKTYGMKGYLYLGMACISIIGLLTTVVLMATK